MDEVLFFIAGIAAVAGAVGVVTLRNPFYSVLSLVSHLFALAVLFLLLMAQFVAAAQIVVYAGAVMVLYVFVVAYIGGQDQPVGPSGGRAPHRPRDRRGDRPVRRPRPRDARLGPRGDRRRGRDSSAATSASPARSASCC